MSDAQNNGHNEAPEKVSRVILDWNRETNAFSIASNVPSAIEQIGLLEFALLEVKRLHAEKAAAAGPRIVPGTVLPMRRV